MVGVWIDPVTAQVMMTLLMARGLPLVLDARPTGGCDGSTRPPPASTSVAALAGWRLLAGPVEA